MIYSFCAIVLGRILVAEIARAVCPDFVVAVTIEPVIVAQKA